jgi:phosphotransferase system enzyme I (PtsI)
MFAESAKEEKIFKGIPASAGITTGFAFVIRNKQTSPNLRLITDQDVPNEIEKLEQALLYTRKQILEIQRKVAEAMGRDEAAIFDAQLLVLEDQTLLDEIIKYVKTEKVSIDYAFKTVSEKYCNTLESLGDDYLKERIADIRDVANRVIDNLSSPQSETLDISKLDKPCIIVSHDLSPSTTAQLDKTKVLAFTTDVGSQTSHTAILARSLQIPAVVGLGNISQTVKTSDFLLIDGFNGIVILNPSEQTLLKYGQISKKQIAIEQSLKEIKDKTPTTKDGHTIVISANIETPDEIPIVKESGAQGVGLFRTEFLFLKSTSLPSEDEQYQVYKTVASELKPSPVIIRTLDLGGDKFASHINLPNEVNPFLGWRAIRLCLHQIDIFKTQLRAILRASTEGNVKLMYPMISNINEVIQANEILEACKDELKSKSIPFDPNIEVGVMIEVPSAVMIADSLAKRVKFFSIGTNDLTQYTLAVDRVNERIAHLYEPTHPAIVRLIHETVQAAHRHNIWVGVCGEAAGDPLLTPLLIGLSVDELSCAAPIVPHIKKLVCNLDYSEARKLAGFALECEFGTEILAKSKELAEKSAPELFFLNTNNP